MQSVDKTLKAHLFICTKNKANKSCCYDKGAESLFLELKEWVAKEQLKRKIKVSASTCLGFCETGITAVIYPQNQWFHHISQQDVPKIKQMLKSYAE